MSAIEQSPLSCRPGGCALQSQISSSGFTDPPISLNQYHPVTSTNARAFKNSSFTEMCPNMDSLLICSSDYEGTNHKINHYSSTGTGPRCSHACTRELCFLCSDRSDFRLLETSMNLSSDLEFTPVGLSGTQGIENQDQFVPIVSQQNGSQQSLSTSVESLDEDVTELQRGIHSHCSKVSTLLQNGTTCQDSSNLKLDVFGSTHNGDTVIEERQAYGPDFGDIEDQVNDSTTQVVELMERCYGGRIRAQRAARVIQNFFRSYRMRAEYARIRLERCHLRNSGTGSSIQTTDSDYSSNLLSPVSRSESEKLSMKPSESFEDLVLEQAYVDWALKAATEQASCGLSSQSDSTSVSLGDCVSVDSGEQQFALPVTSITSLSAASWEKSDELRPYHSLCPMSEDLKNDTSIRLSVDKSDQAISDGYRVKRPVVTRNFSVGPLNLSDDSSVFVKHVTPSVMSGELRRRTSPVRKLSSPTLVRRNLIRIVPYHTQPVVSPSQPICSNLPGLSTTPEPLFSHRTWHSANGFPSVRLPEPPQRTACCRCCRTNVVHCQNPKGLTVDSLNFADSSALFRQNTSASTSVTLSSSICPRQTLYCHSVTNTSTQAHSRPVLVAVSSSLVHRRPNGHVRNSSVTLHQTAHPSSDVNRSMVLTNCSTSHCAKPACVYPPMSSDAFAFSGNQFHQMARHFAKQQQAKNAEKRRKRIYRIGLNIFNRSPLKGIEYLIRFNFLDSSPETVARFLLIRKGLSRVAIGDYLGNLKDELAMASTRQFMRELNFRDQEVDEALRSLLGCFRTPGESQKIVHLLTEFQSAYVEQNASRIKTRFRNPDSVMVLAYAIIMLHTDIHNPSIRPQSKMTREEFVRNLRGVDGGEDLDRNLLTAIYERIQTREMSVLPDHTDQVRKIQQHLTGPNRPINLAIPQRRLVCYCRLFEVPDKNKKERIGAHQREVFLFNDLLLITKAVQKKRRDASIAYQVRASFTLLGMRLAPFETQYYPHGLELLHAGRIEHSDPQVHDKHPTVATPTNRSRILVSLNTKTMSDRARFIEDLQECILEVTEMERFRVEEEIGKQSQLRKQPVNKVFENLVSENRDNSECSNTIVQKSSHCLDSPNRIAYSSTCPSHDRSHSVGVVHQSNFPNRMISNDHYMTKTFTSANTTCECKSDHTCRLSRTCVRAVTTQEPAEKLEYVISPNNKSGNLLENAQRLSGDSGLSADIDASLQHA